ncbi:hypothetical protein BO71DRAFT_403442 [Aspergillus ellipticus CBS 707.79]|uniref:Uncharacterized protein n=1 Tax=Aspergillus ellipticus CBS 707.79 TaxID=1448320 RepID=A0A319CWS1_9EURO|nr:hypothetical protein BO71DRAFT_403442 [Aspergillus ellipticus CBS 707.79]
MEWTYHRSQNWPYTVYTVTRGRCFAHRGLYPYCQDQTGEWGTRQQVWKTSDSVSIISVALLREDLSNLESPCETKWFFHFHTSNPAEGMSHWLLGPWYNSPMGLKFHEYSKDAAWDIFCEGSRSHLALPVHICRHLKIIAVTRKMLLGRPQSTLHASISLC